MELPIGRASSSAMRRRRIGKPTFRLVVCIAAVFAVTAVFHALPLRDRPSAPAFVFLFLVYIVSARGDFAPRSSFHALQPWRLIGCSRRSAGFGSVILVTSLCWLHSSSWPSLPAIFQAVRAERL
jgi:hypothetical protein